MGKEGIDTGLLRPHTGNAGNKDREKKSSIIYRFLQIMTSIK